MEIFLNQIIKLKFHVIKKKKKIKIKKKKREKKRGFMFWSHICGNYNTRI